jgi:hypothetical protein
VEFRAPRCRQRLFKYEYMTVVSFSRTVMSSSPDIRKLYTFLAELRRLRCYVPEKFSSDTLAQNEHSLLGCVVTLLGRCIALLEDFLFGLLFDPEDRGSKFLRKFGVLPNCKGHIPDDGILHGDRCGNLRSRLYLNQDVTKGYMLPTQRNVTFCTGQHCYVL